eukprot:2324898-Lingulodinium_polyedra.AAC.1
MARVCHRDALRRLRDALSIASNFNAESGSSIAATSEDRRSRGGRGQRVPSSRAAAQHQEECQ